MTRRQAYWQDLRIIHSATGVWVRRMSFRGAHEWVSAYTGESERSYAQDMAAQRAYDLIATNSKGTYVPLGEVKVFAWS